MKIFFKYNFLPLILFFILFTYSCADYQKFMQQEAIDKFEPKDFAEEKEITLNETEDIGPKDVDTEFYKNKIERRTFISENIVTDYRKIINKDFAKTFPISVNFDDTDIRTVMKTFSVMTGKNILVGDEVSGSVKARVVNEDWDDVLEAILEIKNLAIVLNKETNIVRIHQKDIISEQEEYARERQAKLIDDLQQSETLDPIRSEMFKLFYSDPEKVKDQIEEILSNIETTTLALGTGEANDSESSNSSGASSRVKISIDERLRALVVLGTIEDLDFIERLINTIDVPTQQILIEAFVVEAGSDFDKELGARVGARYDRSNVQVPGIIGENPDIAIGGITGGAATSLTLGGTTGSISNQAAAGATGSLGMLVDFNTLDLQVELTALESMGISKIISNPKVFTLNNETAVITQGVEIPYETTSAEGTETEFKEAALKLEVTPTIIGDGNIILDVQINKDSANTSLSNPPISKTEISTKLLVQNKTIVVIGGIYKETLSDSVSKTPLLSDVPVIGNLFKKVKKGEDLDRLLIFIAPRIL